MISGSLKTHLIDSIRKETMNILLLNGGNISAILQAV